MKFTYDRKTEARNCAAYIDGDDDLVIFDGVGLAFIIYADGRGSGVTMWKPSIAKHKFYAGDSITITF